MEQICLGLLLLQMVTIQKRQQLRLLVGFTPPTSDELMTEGETNCYGKISVVFPAPAASSSSTRASRKPLLMLSEEQPHQPSEERLSHALLGGLLELLHPKEDPRVLLSVGIAALQQEQNRERRQEQEAGRDQPLLQQRLLLQQLGRVWPTAAQRAAAALGPVDCNQWARSARVGNSAVPESEADSAYQRDYTQSISLVGVCRQSLLLLLSPPEEAPCDQQRQQLAASAGWWATYSTPTTPMVIDFNTTHVNARKYPIKLLQLRAVSASPMSWHLAPCSGSNSGSSEKETYDPMDGQTGRASQSVSAPFLSALTSKP